MKSITNITCLSCLFVLLALTGKAQQATRTPVSLDVPVAVTATSNDTATVIERSSPVNGTSVAPVNKDADNDKTPVIIHEIQPADKPKKNQ
jgi:hypothetical protein